MRSSKAKLIDIEIALAHQRWFDFRNNLVVFNVNGWGGELRIFHECDMLVCSKAGYLTEVEIKRTWSDFLADFKKDHKHENKGLIKFFYYCVPESFDLRKVYAKLKEHNIAYSGIITYNDFLLFRQHYHEDGGIRSLPGFRKLSVEGRLELARLGAMRVIGLKKKLAKFYDK